MRIRNQITVYAGGIREDASAGKRKDDVPQRQSRTVYAGDVQNSAGLRDRIEHRKGIAKNHAEKIVRDAWNGDKKLDRELDQLDRYTAELRQTIREQLGMIHDAAKQKEELREVYGISDEMMESLDRHSTAMAGGDKLTEEEEAYYQDITQQGWYAEYRQRMSELNNVAAEGWKTINRAGKKAMLYNMVAKKIHEERLKVHPMLDAQEKAQKVLDAAAEDVVGMVMDDTKEKMDEQQKEREEKAEVIQEEKEAREELLEERREEDEELERLLEEISLEQTAYEGVSQVQMRQQLLEIQNQIETEVQQEIRDIQNKMNLSVEALKNRMGLTVDIKL